ncbi:MAG: nickel-responsive transcriptional regulator NikR [Euryarchaeota archaeon]|nr:nickel-responsive transcriptional regulator NikR [Euryarchaeota archaeon]
MEKMTRFGVSIPPQLLKKFDELIDAKGYANRSEAIRDMVRDLIIEKQEEKGNVVGTITLLYDHDVKGVMERLTDLQHHRIDEIASTIHLHLDEHHCLEVIVVKGESQRVRKLADTMIATKGVKHGKLVMTTSLEL